MEPPNFNLNFSVKTFFPERWAQNHFSTKPFGGAFQEGGAFPRVESLTPKGNALKLTACLSGKFQPTMPQGRDRLSQRLWRECLLLGSFLSFSQTMGFALPSKQSHESCAPRSLVLEISEISILHGISICIRRQLPCPPYRLYCLRQMI